MYEQFDPCPSCPLMTKKSDCTKFSNQCTDASAKAADFVNCSSFYANIYPSEINRIVVNCSVLSPLVEQQQSSSSLPDLRSISDGKNLTMQSSSLQQLSQKCVASDADVDSRLFHKQRSNSSSNSTEENNKADEPCNEDSQRVVGKTNSLQCDNTDHPVVASLVASKDLSTKNCLKMQSGLVEEDRCKDETMTTLGCGRVDVNSKANEVIDVEREEEMLRQASMVSTGLHKKDEPQPTKDYVIIEDVSDEEFQQKNITTVDSDTEVKSVKPKKEKIPSLNLDDPLLKGFEVALDKISLNKENGGIKSDTVLDYSPEDISTGDDPITKRAIERLDKKLQEVLKTSKGVWPEKTLTLCKESNRSNAQPSKEEGVVQLRKNVRRTPTPRRKSAHSLNSSPPPITDSNVKAATSESNPKEHSEAAEEKISNGGEKSFVTLEVKVEGKKETEQPLQNNEAEQSNNKGIFKATFITPILRRKISPPRPILESFRSSAAFDEEPLDLRSFRNNHLDRVFSVPSSPIWPSFSSRFGETAQQIPFDYNRPRCLSHIVDRSRMSPGLLRNERLLPGAMTSDRLMNQSPHRVFAENDWRWQGMDMGSFPQYGPPPFEQIATAEPSPFDENISNLSSVRITSRRPLHAREQLRVYTDRASPHLANFRTESTDFKTTEQGSKPFGSSFRHYVGQSCLESNQDPLDPITRKALERFDCCTTNSPRTPSSSTALTSSSYNNYQDPIVRSAVMRMDNQLAAAYTRRPDYPPSLSRRSSINYIDTCDSLPENGTPLLSMREDGTSNSVASLNITTNGLRSREGSLVPPSIVEQLENRNARGMRHIFNYLEDNDYKLSQCQSTFKQTPSRQYFSSSREYTRPKVRTSESISSRLQSERTPEFDLGSSTPPNPLLSTDRLPPKNAADTNNKQFLRGSSSYSNLYMPKDNSGSVDYEVNEINSCLEGQQPSSSARSTPAISPRQVKGRSIEVPITHQKRCRKPSGISENADRCRSLERTSSRNSFTKGNAVTSDSPRISPARSRRGLSLSTSQPKPNRMGRPSVTPTQQDNRRKSDQRAVTGRVKQPVNRRSQTPRLSVANAPKPESESEYNGRTTPLKWQMSVFERLYYNRKR